MILSRSQLEKYYVCPAFVNRRTGRQQDRLMCTFPLVSKLTPCSLPWTSSLAAKASTTTGTALKPTINICQSKKRGVCLLQREWLQLLRKLRILKPPLRTPRRTVQTFKPSSYSCSSLKKDVESRLKLETFDLPSSTLTAFGSAIHVSVGDLAASMYVGVLTLHRICTSKEG